MSDRKWDPMNEDDFDAILENSLPDLPPEDIVAGVTPWRRATRWVLIGMGLTTITLSYMYLDYILPAIGMVLLLLGFRSLRRENRWFGVCYGITVLRAVYVFADLILNSTILQSRIHAMPQMAARTGIHLILLFVEFFCLWGGFRAVQRKAGLPPHGGGAVALMVWYGAMCLLALVGYVGLILGVALLVMYILIICSLWKLSKELDQAGYAIRPAPVRLEDGTVALAITVLLVGGCICGWLFGSSYPMEWTPVDAEEHSEAAEIEAKLLELGVPEYVVNDLTAEDLAACDGALRATVEVNDSKETELSITGVGIELPGEQERWMIIQHFLWKENPGFYGTESIQLWPPIRIATGGVLEERSPAGYCIIRTGRPMPPPTGSWGSRALPPTVFSGERRPVRMYLPLSPCPTAVKTTGAMWPIPLRRPRTAISSAAGSIIPTRPPRSSIPPGQLWRPE